MTNQEWKTRSANRILRAVTKAGRIRIRDLKRTTNYHRGPEDGIYLWYAALEYLEKSKRVVCERDENGTEAFVTLPEIAKILGYRPGFWDNSGRYHSRAVVSVSD
jgi:hypothetical protein